MHQRSSLECMHRTNVWYLATCDDFSLYVCTNYTRQFNYVFTLLRWCFHHSFSSDIMAWPLVTRVHNMRQFYTGGGREPVIIFWWLLWFWCGHSAVTPDQSPRLYFKSVCHEHHQVTLMSWNQRSEVLVQQLNVPVVLVSLYFIPHDQKQYLNM